MKRIWQKSELGADCTIKEYYLERADGEFAVLQVYKTQKDEVSLSFGDNDPEYYPNAKAAERVALEWLKK